MIFDLYTPVPNPVGIIFTGIMVALAINAASTSFENQFDVEEIKASIEEMQ